MQSSHSEGKDCQPRFCRLCESSASHQSHSFQLTNFDFSMLSSRLNYAQKHLSIPTKNFIARIGLTNAGSIALFNKLGFGKEKVVEVFQEVTMRMGWVEGAEDGKMNEGERVEGLRKERWVEVGEEVEID